MYGICIYGTAFLLINAEQDKTLTQYNNY